MPSSIFDEPKQNKLQAFCQRNQPVFICIFVFGFLIAMVGILIIGSIIAYYLVVLADDFDTLIKQISIDYNMASTFGHQLIDKIKPYFDIFMMENYPQVYNMTNTTV